MSEKIEPYKGIAITYDEIRPSYPEDLIRDIITKTNSKKDDRLLEIGAGTGKATVQFAEKGFSIHAIELGEDMAEIFKDKCKDYQNVSIDITSFEKWNNPGDLKYDMIYCAQAFHWLDKAVKFKKCHTLLKENGYLILFWYNPCDELPETLEIEEQVYEIIKSYTSELLSSERKTERQKHDGVSMDKERRAEIEASGLFELVDKIEYLQKTQNNASQYIKAMTSVPAFASLLDLMSNECIDGMNKDIEAVINQYGGAVTSGLKFTLYITKKIN